MGIFSESSNNGRVAVNMNALVELFLADDLRKLSGAQLAEFCAPGGTGEALTEAKVLGKKTLVRLSKSDDLERRSTMAAMQLAKENKDPLFDKLVANRVKEKELLGKIRAKYGAKATKAAIVAQKEYIKTMKKVPGSFMKSGGKDRLG